LTMSRFLRDIMAFLPQAQPGEDMLAIIGPVTHKAAQART